MLERVHEHMIAEVKTSNRTDTILIISAMLFNMTTLCINSSAAFTVVAMAETEDESLLALDISFTVLVVIVLAINAIALYGLLSGRRTRQRLLEGLAMMYEDNQVEKYYDRSLISAYGHRYLIFSGVIIVLGLASIVVPLVLRLLL